MLHVKDGGTLSQGWRHCQQHCEMFLKGTLCAGVRRTVGRKRRKSPPWASRRHSALTIQTLRWAVPTLHLTPQVFAWRHHALCYSPRPTDNGNQVNPLNQFNSPKLVSCPLPTACCSLLPLPSLSPAKHDAEWRPVQGKGFANLICQVSLIRKVDRLRAGNKRTKVGGRIDAWVA